MCYKEAYYYLTVVSRNLILAGSGKKEGLHLGLQSVILTQGKIKKNTLNTTENMHCSMFHLNSLTRNI